MSAETENTKETEVADEQPTELKVKELDDVQGGLSKVELGSQLLDPTATEPSSEQRENGASGIKTHNQLWGDWF